jgi:hypothetical protein
MTVRIQLQDGRIVSAGESYEMICEQNGLSGDRSISRDTGSPDRWTEWQHPGGVFLSPEAAKYVATIQQQPAGSTAT